MKKSCKVTQNPCKICFQTVTKKNGVQCQGICRKWVHFVCLNYTPGKIKDIKAGYIKIMCPCPDCTSEPKEILVNPPFTCVNQKCPANSKPKCESQDCPANQGGIVCGKEQCSKNVAFDDSTSLSMPQHTPPQYGCPQHCPPQYSPPQYCPPQYDASQCMPPLQYESYNNTKPRQVREECPPERCCTSGVLLRTDSNTILIQPTDSNSSNGRPSNMKSQSCCCVSKGAGSAHIFSPPAPEQAPRKQSISDSRINFGNKNNFDNNDRYDRSMENALEQMCNTVGLLSHQIRNLMCKIVDNTR